MLSSPATASTEWRLWGMKGGHQRGFRVPRELKQAIDVALRPLKDDVARYEGSCLFVINDVGGYCNAPVSNRCHIVSNAKVLSRHKDRDGRVLEFRWGVNQWRHLLLSSDEEHPIDLLNPEIFHPFPVSPDDACVGRFACKPSGQAGHDDVFQSIDVEEPDFDDQEVRLLAAYRLVLYQVDQYRQAIELMEKWDGLVGTRPKGGSRAVWLAEKQKIQSGYRGWKPLRSCSGKLGIPESLLECLVLILYLCESWGFGRS